MKFLYYIVIVSLLLGCKAQYISKNDLKSGFETYDLKDYDQRIKHNKIDVYEGNNYIEYRGTDIYIYPKHKYYRVVKEFYNNGSIKEKGLQFGYVNIGIWEYYNEEGKLIKTIDEDKKFNPNFSYNDILDYLHERKTINKYRKWKKLDFNVNYDEKNKIWWIRVYRPTKELSPEGYKIDNVREYSFDYKGNILEQNEKIKYIRGDHI